MNGPPGALADQYDALGAGAGAYDLGRDVVSVTGPDAESYLQGQCSQDVSALAEGESAEALLLSPQGKVEVYLRVTRRAHGEYLLDADAGTGPAIVARLERFKLRVAVTIEPLEWACIAVRGPDAARAVREGPELVVPVSWPGLSGFDLLGPRERSGAARWAGEPAVPCGEAAFEARRIEAGIPVAGREITGATIAAEVGLVERTVSFTKGCFTGQELVARLDARGTKVARRLVGVVVAGGPADVPPVGAAVLSESGEESGTLTSVAWSPGLGGAVALTLLHRRVSAPAPVEVRVEEDAGPRMLAAEARELPLVA